MAQAYNPLREDIKEEQYKLGFKTRKAYKKYKKKFSEREKPQKHEIHEMFYKDNPEARTDHWKRFFNEN